MMKWSIDPWAYFLWAVYLLLVPIDWLMASAIAATVHELCHIAMVYFLDGDVLQISIRPGGAEILTTPMDLTQELLCALAGPTGSFCLVLFCNFFPKTAICAVMQGLFNLLPVYPLDGGRALRCALALLRRKRPCKDGQFHVQ